MHTARTIVKRMGSQYFASFRSIFNFLYSLNGIPIFTNKYFTRANIPISINEVRNSEIKIIHKGTSFKRNTVNINGLKIHRIIS